MKASLSALVLLGCAAAASAQTNSTCAGVQSVYSRDLPAVRGGKNVTMDAFAGSVSLAINVASF